MFANYVAFIDKTIDEASNKLEKWRHTLEFKGFKLSRLKTENLSCGFSGGEEGSREVTIDGIAIPRVEKFNIWARSFK